MITKLEKHILGDIIRTMIKNGKSPNDIKITYPNLQKEEEEHIKRSIVMR